jgi:hypothetical protein
MTEEIQIHTRIQAVISSFKTEMETTVFGSIPEVVIDFVLKAKNELEKIKTDSLTPNNIYLKSSEEIVTMATTVIKNWELKADNQMTELKYVPVSGMKHGANFYEVCCKAIRILSKFEMSEETKAWFNKHAASFLNAETSSEGCFIATACYGDYDHPIVIQLRHFRDKYLNEKKWGKRFITYYYKHSPSFARFVSKYSTLKSLVRTILILPLFHISKIIQPLKSKLP